MQKGIEKSKSTRTAKIEAKKLLTKYINQILREKHEDPIIINGEAVMVTKAEALARFVVKSALGYVEIVSIIDKESGKKLGSKPVIHSPDKTYITMIYDRVEGKVPTVEVKETDSKPTVADKVSREGKSRLNKLAKK